MSSSLTGQHQSITARIIIMAALILAMLTKLNAHHIPFISKQTERRFQGDDDPSPIYRGLVEKEEKLKLHLGIATKDGKITSEPPNAVALAQSLETNSSPIECLPKNVRQDLSIRLAAATTNDDHIDVQSRLVTAFVDEYFSALQQINEIQSKGLVQDWTITIYADFLLFFLTTGLLLALCFVDEQSAKFTRETANTIIRTFSKQEDEPSLSPQETRQHELDEVIHQTKLAAAHADAKEQHARGRAADRAHAPKPDKTSPTTEELRERYKRERDDEISAIKAEGHPPETERRLIRDAEEAYEKKLNYLRERKKA